MILLESWLQTIKLTILVQIIYIVISSLIQSYVNVSEETDCSRYPSSQDWSARAQGHQVRRSAPKRDVVIPSGSKWFVSMIAWSYLIILIWDFDQTNAMWESRVDQAIGVPKEARVLVESGVGSRGPSPSNSFSFIMFHDFWMEE